MAGLLSSRAALRLWRRRGFCWSTVTKAPSWYAAPAPSLHSRVWHFTASYQAAPLHWLGSASRSCHPKYFSHKQLAVSSPICRVLWLKFDIYCNGSGCALAGCGYTWVVPGRARQLGRAQPACGRGDHQRDCAGDGVPAFAGHCARRSQLWCVLFFNL